jgi:2-iminoacetate synthase ThiH
MTELHERDE